MKIHINNFVNNFQIFNFSKQFRKMFVDIHKTHIFREIYLFKNYNFNKIGMAYLSVEFFFASFTFFAIGLSIYLYAYDMAL